MVFVMHIGWAFSELLVALSDHTVTQNVRSIHVAQLVVDLCWKLLLSMQKSDNCLNLTVGRKQYQCSLQWSGWHIGNMLANGPKGRWFKSSSHH